MYEQEDKIFIVDYFIYTPSNTMKRILTYITPAFSRKSAEQMIRELEKGSRVTIVKIQSICLNEIDSIFREEFKFDAYH